MATKSSKLAFIFVAVLVVAAFVTVNTLAVAKHENGWRALSATGTHRSSNGVLEDSHAFQDQARHSGYSRSRIRRRLRWSASRPNSLTATASALSRLGASTEPRFSRSRASRAIVARFAGLSGDRRPSENP